MTALSLIFLSSEVQRVLSSCRELTNQGELAVMEFSVCEKSDGEEFFACTLRNHLLQLINFSIPSLMYIPK